MSNPYEGCDFAENDDLEGNDEDMALRSILSWGDDDDDDDNDRQSSAASMASSNEALGGGPTSVPQQQRAAAPSEDDSTSSFLAQLKAEYSAGGINANNFGGSLHMLFSGPNLGSVPTLNMQTPAQSMTVPMSSHNQDPQRSQDQPQQQQRQRAQQQKGVRHRSSSASQTPQQPQVIAPAPTPTAASPAPQPTPAASQTGFAPIQPQAQIFQPQPQAPAAPLSVPPGIPNFLAAMPLQQQFNLAAADPAAFLRQMQAMQQQQQQRPDLLQQQTMQQQQMQQQQLQQQPAPSQQQQQQQPVLTAMPQSQPVSQQQSMLVPEQRIAPQAPPIQAPQTSMVPPTAAPTPGAKAKQSRRKSPQSKIASPPPVALNIVSCSDTDGLTTDAEPSGMRAAAKTSKDKSPLKLAPSMATQRGNKGGASAKNKEAPDDGKTPQERAKANRDRNREHARNTRLRKKAYLEKLKVTVEELCRERDSLVSERAGAANLLVEMHNTRTDVLLSFFALRSAYEKRRELWSSILDESCFTCVMPVTPYRSFPSSEVQVARCQRTILGIDGMMSDTASLHVLLNSLVDRSRFPDATIQFRYTLVTEDAVVAGNQMMARWMMTTINATECGAGMEVSKRGMLCCKFNSAHKITGLELMFDVMAFMLQLKQSVGTDSFAVVPNTVQTCQRPYDTPMVMTLSERPYTIVQVNKLWEEMTGWKAEDVVGKTSCRILQGQETEEKDLEVLMSSIRYKRPAFTAVTNYTKTGRKFKNFLNVYPLSTDSKITHYVGLTTYAGWADGGGSTAPLSKGAKEMLKDDAGQAIPTPSKQEQEKTNSKQAPQVSVVSSSNATMASSINTHQAVAPRAPQPPSQAQQPQPGGRQPQVVVAGPTSRQDSCNTGGADTVSSLTGSVSSSSSGGSGGSGNDNSEPLCGGPPNSVPNSSLPGTMPMDISRTAVTTASSCSSAGGSTSTNSSSSDRGPASAQQKRGSRKRKSKAGEMADTKQKTAKVSN